MLNRHEWANAKEAQAIQPADWKEGIRNIVAYAKFLGHELMGVNVEVTVVSTHNKFLACYGSGKLHFNLYHLGSAWFEQGANVEVDGLLLHELGHQYSGDHLSEDSKCRARLASFTGSRKSPNGLGALSNQPSRRDARVEGGRSDAAVTQDLLDGVQVGPQLDQPRGKAVTQQMRSYALRQSGRQRRQPARARHRFSREVRQRLVAGKQPVLRSGHPPALPQGLEQQGRQRHQTVFRSLARADMNHHPLAVDVLWSEANRFADPQAGGINGQQDDPLFELEEHIVRAARLPGG